MDSKHASGLTLSRQLAQVLSIEKLPLGFFIGAGCPVSIKTAVIADGGGEPVAAPLIPDVAGLTALILQELKGSDSFQQTIERILECLQEDEVHNQNIEVILGFVRTLQAAAGKGDARGIRATELLSIDAGICAAIQKRVDRELPDKENPYRQLAKFIAPRRVSPVEIFTTNYDLLMEQALEEAAVPYFDGFVGSRHPFFDLIAIDQDRLPPRWARLWKLHGSINWRQNSSTKRVCRTRDCSVGPELLIHPSHRKYDDSRRMPYLALLDRLRAFLRNDHQPVALFLHGFSFSDEHLNAVLEEGMRANPQSVCFAFQYADLDNYPHAERLASRCHNLAVFGADGEVTRGVRKEWRVQQPTSGASLDLMFDWNAADFSPEAQSVKARLKLGDFAAFGDYISTFSAADQVGSEGAHA